MLQKVLKTGKLRLWSYYRDIERSNHKLNYLFWECTLNCNFFCKHCGSSAGRKLITNELNTSEIKKALKEIAQDFDPYQIMLAVTGGEPLLRKDLFEVMQYATSLGFSWGMVTNGFLVSKKIIEKMRVAGMKTVVVSIDGINDTHDNFRNMPGAYKKSVNAVKLLAEGKFLENLQITTTIHKGNIKQLENMYNVFTKLPITSWRVMNVDPIGRALANKELLLNGAGLRELLIFIKNKRKKSKIDITYGCAGFLGLDFEGEVRDRYFDCLAGISVGSILHNGDIFVCPNVVRLKEWIQGNIRKDRFSEVWKNKFELFRDRGRTKSKMCNGCSFFDECLGGSFHLWDHGSQSPKFCHLQMIENI